MYLLKAMDCCISCSYVFFPSVGLFRLQLQLVAMSNLFSQMFSSLLVSIQ